MQTQTELQAVRNKNIFTESSVYSHAHTHTRTHIHKHIKKIAVFSVKTSKMKMLWNVGFSIVMILMVLRKCESREKTIQGEQPLSKIAIHKAVFALDHSSSSIRAYPSFLGFKVI